MSLWSRRLGWRLAIAFACSVTAIAVLAAVVERFDAPPKPTKRARSAVTVKGGAELAGSSRGATAKSRGANKSAGSADLSRVSPSAPATLARALGFRLQATRGTIMLAHRESSLAPDIVPVVEILANGKVVLRRPMPIAVGPGQDAPLSGQGHGGGVILPVMNLELLTPEARAALIGLLQLWVTERPVLPTKLSANDLRLVPEAVRRLLSWVP
jgi:hypothetical protein